MIKIFILYRILSNVIYKYIAYSDTGIIFHLQTQGEGY
jgi:hypothetical protein